MARGDQPRPLSRWGQGLSKAAGDYALPAGSQMNVSWQHASLLVRAGLRGGTLQPLRGVWTLVLCTVQVVGHSAGGEADSGGQALSRRQRRQLPPHGELLLVLPSGRRNPPGRTWARGRFHSRGKVLACAHA